MKISLPENVTMVNLKSVSFIVIMLLHEGLTHIHSQIKPHLLFGESFTLIQRNFPQSNLTWPNKSNVVTVFDSFYEGKNTTAVRGEASVLPPVLPTLCHTSARKIASVTGKNFNSQSVCVEKKNGHDGQPSRLRLQWTFPRKTSSGPASDRVRQHPVYWWRICNLVWKLLLYFYIHMITNCTAH